MMATLLEGWENVREFLTTAASDDASVSGEGSNADRVETKARWLLDQINERIPQFDALTSMIRDLDEQASQDVLAPARLREVLDQFQLDRLREASTTWISAINRLSESASSGEKAATFRELAFQCRDRMCDYEISVALLVKSLNSRLKHSIGEPHSGPEAGMSGRELMPPWDKAVRVKAVPGKLRLPDPPFETGEGPAPFDLPLPGTWKRVKARPGRVRLPDPIDYDEPEGAA